MSAPAYRLQQATCDHIGRVLDAARLNQMARGILLVTPDPDTAVAAAAEVGRVHGVVVHSMSMASRRVLRPGASEFEEVSGPAVDPVDVLRAGDTVSGPALVLYRDVLRFVSDSHGDPRARAFLLQMISAGNRRPHVYAFCEPPGSEALVPSFAEALLPKVVVSLPRGRELLSLAREELAIAGARSAKALDARVLEEWAKRLAAELLGLTHSSARFAIQDALGPAFELDAAVRTLTERKAALLQDRLAMEIVRQGGEPPVGMENFFRWVQLNRDRMCVPGRDRVKGALLLGPPGTGKTRLGAYVAHLLRVPGIWFRFGALLGRYVGQSEENVERACAVLDAQGSGDDGDPGRGAVVILDEIEKTVSRGDNDGGVSRRVTSRLLTWMSESTAPNMILATANDLECMGELADIITRRGRLDRVFFVDVPGARARSELFERLLRRANADASFELDDLVEASERFTGADIESVVQDAQAEARATGDALATQHVLGEIVRNRVRVLAQYERFGRLREWARLNAVMAGQPDATD